MINPYLVNRGDLRPAHMHDCEKCEFQGMHEHQGKLYDVYLHPRDDSSVEGMKYTIVARYSSEESEYLSFPLELAEQISCDQPTSRWGQFTQVVSDHRLWSRQSSLARQEAMHRNFVASLARPD